jgi:hypothetical protein
MCGGGVMLEVLWCCRVSVSAVPAREECGREEFGLLLS